MNRYTALRRIRKARPTTPEEFAWAGVPLGRCLGAGVFREVVKVKDCDLVVKFPLAEGTMPASGNPDRHCGRWHSTIEMRRIKQLYQFTWMRKYLPKVYYHDRKSGVLVMRYYEPFDEGIGLCLLDPMRFFINDLLKAATGRGLEDFHDDNIAVRPGTKGNGLVLTDLGY